MTTVDRVFAERVNTHRPMLLTQAIRLTRDTDDAEDLVQDALIKAMLNAHQYQPGTNLPAWLYTILRNLFINNYRQKRAEFVDIDRLVGDESTLGTIFPAISVNEGPVLVLNQQLDQAINRLPIKLQNVIQLRRIGYQYDEIAAELQLSLGTVRCHLFTARCLLEGSSKYFGRSRKRRT